MKKRLIAAAVLVLCAALVAGVLFALPQTSTRTEPPTSSVPAVESFAVVSAEEPGQDNTTLPMTEITVDLYRLPADVKDRISPYKAAWSALCDALDAQTPTYTFASAEEKAVLLEALQCLSFAKLFSVNGSGLDVTFQYKNSYIEDRQFLVMVAESILRENVYAEANQLEIAVILYSYLVTNVETNEKYTSMYDVFNEYKGSARAVAEAYGFLLAQFDIDCSLVSGDRNVLLAAVINGQCLYFAPTAEMNTDHTRGLGCFAMDKVTAVKTCGSFEIPALSDGSAPYALQGVFTGCTDWRLDAAAHYLYLAYGSSEFTASVSTEELAAVHG